MAIINKLAPFTQDIITAYRNGQSACSIARYYKSSTSTVTRVLKNAGVMPALARGERDPLVKEDRQKAIDLFNKGVRPADICRKLGRSKNFVYQNIKSSGANLRGLGDWTPSTEQKEKKAQSIQEAGRLNSTEKLINSLLTKQGIETVPQMAFKSYNVDIGIPSHSIAVEILCRGTFPKYIRNGWLVDRIKQLGECGWHTYVLYGWEAHMFEKWGIQDMLAWIDFIHRQPALRCQYRMIRCPNKLLAAGCFDDCHLASVFAPKNFLKVT